MNTRLPRFITKKGDMMAYLQGYWPSVVDHQPKLQLKIENNKINKVSLHYTTLY
jgi:hypothetical protein